MVEDKIHNMFVLIWLRKKKVPEAMRQIISSYFWYGVFEYENYLI